MLRFIKVNSGEFNIRVVVQVDTATDTDVDQNGAQLEVWDRVGTDFTLITKFEVDPSRPGGAEYFAEEKRRVENKATFKVRFSSKSNSINPATHRILFDGKIWDVTRVYDPNGKRVEIYIEAKAVI